MAPKPELVRLAAAPAVRGRGGYAVIDRAGTLPGRGAYLCRSDAVPAPKHECARLAARNGGIQRALRRAVEFPAGLLDDGSPDDGSLESEAR